MAFFSALKRWALAAFAAFVLVAYSYFKGRKSGLAGVEAQLDKSRADELERVSEIKVDVKKTVDSLPDGGASDRLKSGWVRDESV